MSADLDQILDLVSESVILTDLEGRITRWNRAAESIFGYSAEEMLGSTPARLYPGIAAEDLASDLAGVREGKDLIGEWTGRRKDGSEVRIEIHTRLLRDADGEPEGFVGVATDVTQRRLTERALASSDAIASFISQASAILSSSDAFETTLAEVARHAVRSLCDWCTLDVRLSDGRFERVIAAHADPAHADLARKALRYPPGSHAEHPPAKAIQLGAPLVIPDVDDATRVRVTSTPEHEALHRAIGTRSFLVVPVTGPDGAVAVLSFAQSQSGRRFDARDLEWAGELQRRASSAVALARALRERTALLQRAEQANRAKDEFLAMLGHELRNPLAPILTALELMRMKAAALPAGLDLARERAVIERQAQHMVRLVDDLLDVSRITRGQIDLRRAPVDLAEVISGAVETASGVVESRRHALVVDVPRGLVVDGDRDRLRQVFSNLVANAAKYTDAGGHIEVRAERVGGSVRVQVRDDGRGIDRELLPLVFEVFSQGPRAIDRSEGGLGLGLTIVRSLVALHGGTVRADSDGRGRGSTFEVVLPLVHADAPDQPESAPVAATAAPQVGRVLVVDDNADAGEMLALALESLGWEVHVAHDGPSALAELDRYDADIALLDVGLPVMDGYELARRLRERGSPRRLVAVTGYGQERDRERAREAGFDEHMVKPVSLDRLDAMLRGWQRG